MRILRLLAAFAAGMGDAQQAPKRIALVIGNADYNLDEVDLSEAACSGARSRRRARTRSWWSTIPATDAE